MGKKHLKKESYRYNFFRFFFYILHNFFFYRKVIVNGKENIPKKDGIIFAGNHQNSLMDPLSIIFNSGRQTVFLSRADIFKGKTVKKILNFLKILPIYRKKMDHGNTISKNQKIFDLSVEILEKKQAIGIFPEGTHYGERRLHILKKGMSRIAFQAAVKHNWRTKLKIIPFGIFYDNYFQWKRNIIINYGEGIEIKNYKNEFQKNEKTAINKLNDDLKNSIKKLILDIENYDYYDFYEKTIKIYKDEYLKNKKLKINAENRFKASRIIIKKLDFLFEKNNKEFLFLKEKVDFYFENLKKIKLKNFLFKKNINFLKLFLQTFLLIFMLPFYFFGVINNYLPYKIPLIFNKKIKDKQFHTSIMVATGIFLFPLFYIFQFLFLFLLFEIYYWILFLYLFSLPFMGIFSYYYFVNFKNLILKWRYFFYSKKKNSIFMDLKEKHNSIFEIIKK
ncbi:MAG: hypothetical protein B6I24_01170 [Bacteroidetes bacterium 4572_128]|nr:MAG: hypothetical protein B6I24_01170 [Bacteroidetes bacterium 4572_128]